MCKLVVMLKVIYLHACEIYGIEINLRLSLLGKINQDFRVVLISFQPLWYDLFIWWFHSRLHATVYCKFDFRPFIYFTFFNPQLDICKRMARNYPRAPIKCSLRFAIYVCMGDCSFSNCSCNGMGKYTYCTFESEYNWIGCNNGRHSSFVGLLFYHALVEDTMAKLKYALYFLFRCCI